MSGLRWGVLATGTIARTFASHLPSSRTGRLVAVASRDEGRARALARAHGARAHGSYDALLLDQDVDAVYIATPHPMHATWAIRAAEAGKHVLCEKPLAMNEREATAVVDAAGKHGVFLMEAFMYRCHPQTEALVSLLAAGAVGEVRVVEAVHSFDGGPRLDPAGRLLAADLGGGGILDVGCYCVSGARLVAGADPVTVSGAGHLGPSGVDHWAVASLGFESGIVAHLSCGIAVAQPPLLRVHGSAGSITLSKPWLPTLDGAMTTRIEVDRHGEAPETVAVTAGRDLYAYEADVVADCVASGLREAPSPAPSWADTLGNARVLDAWRRAVGVEYQADRTA